MKTILVILCAFSFPLFACVVEPGELVVEQVGSTNTYKMFLDRKPLNTCIANDSSSLRITVTCCPDGQYEVNWLRSTDTLTYAFHGQVFIAASVTWWQHGTNKGRTDIETDVLILPTTGIGCFEKVGVVPQMATENPPPATGPEIGNENPPPHEIALNGAVISITSPYAGRLLVVDYMANVVDIQEVEIGEFSYDLANCKPGIYYVNVLLFAPQGLISETFQIFVN